MDQALPQRRPAAGVSSCSQSGANHCIPLHAAVLKALLHQNCIATPLGRTLTALASSPCCWEHDRTLTICAVRQCGNNTLHHATHKGFLEAVKLLVEYGVDPEQLNQVPHTQSTLCENLVPQRCGAFRASGSFECGGSQAESSRSLPPQSLPPCSNTDPAAASWPTVSQNAQFNPHISSLDFRKSSAS
jgi:hypothetical protein